MKKRTNEFGNPYEEVGKYLTMVLEQSGIRQIDVVRSFGIDKGSMSKFCSGSELITPRVVQQLATIIREEFRQPLQNIYFEYKAPNSPQSFDYGSAPEGIRDIERMIRRGSIFRAIRSAKELYDTSMDPAVSQGLEDLLFELHIRRGEYGDASALGEHVRLSAGKSMIVKEIRAVGMKGVAARASGNINASSARRLLNSAWELIKNNRSELSSEVFFSTTYEDIILRELGMTYIPRVMNDERANNIRNVIHTLRNRSSQSTDSLQVCFHQVAIGRCFLALGDPGSAEDILEDLLPRCTSTTRDLSERCFILRGQCHVARGEIQLARTAFRIALKISQSRENLHHAHVAQVALSGLFD